MGDHEVSTALEAMASLDTNIDKARDLSFLDGCFAPVTLTGLKAVECNGLSGIVLRYVHEKQRYAIRCHNGSKKLIKAEHLQAHVPNLETCGRCHGPVNLFASPPCDCDLT